METKNKKGCTVLAILFVIFAYISLLIWFGITGAVENSRAFAWICAFIPAIFGIVNLIYLKVNRDRISRKRLIGCAVLVKCTLIPLYLVGGFLIACFFLMSFIPVPFMIFVGLPMAMLLGLYGYMVLLAGNTFLVLYSGRTICSDFIF